MIVDCSLIGIESITLFTCISNVMFTLLSIMKQSENHLELLNWFQIEYGELLIRNFIRPFPFSARLESSRSKKQAIDPQCRDQNLIVCFLWAQLETKSAAKCAEQVFQYLSGNMVSLTTHYLKQYLVIFKYYSFFLHIQAYFKLEIFSLVLPLLRTIN